MSDYIENHSFIFIRLTLESSEFCIRLRVILCMLVGVMIRLNPLTFGCFLPPITFLLVIDVLIFMMLDCFIQKLNPLGLFRGSASVIIDSVMLMLSIIERLGVSMDALGLQIRLNPLTFLLRPQQFRGCTMA